MATKVSDLSTLATPTRSGLVEIAKSTGSSFVSRGVTIGNLADLANHDSLSGFVANEHIDHTSVTLTAGLGLTGGGDISAGRTFAISPATSSEAQVRTSSSKVITPEALGHGLGVIKINTQTSTAYTLALTDIGQAVDLTSTASVTLTVPDSSAVAFEIGTVIEIAQLGAGSVTLNPGSTTTINKPSVFTLTLGGQYSIVRVRKTGTNVWLASGDLALS